MTHHPDHEVELFRDDGAYEVCVDLPEYGREDIDLRWHNGRLHVAADRCDEDAYDRRLSVPGAVDEEAIEATYRDDVLTVRLPVVGESSRPGTRIAVSG
jgi:HSP20 family protein